MSAPYFTIAIPTKNRPDRVGNAVKSLVDQTFADLEVIVCDNSDESDAARTAAVVEAFGDPRVRYVRTNGQLSMPDNWDHAIAGARGAYVGILTDRSVFRRDALQVVHTEIESTGAQLVNWFNDLYGRGPGGNEFKRRESTFKRYRHSGEEILHYFVHGDPKYSTKVIPKLMTSVCQRSVLETIRNSKVGRVCPPVAPDFTSGFLILSHVDFALTLDEALYVSVGTGNGLDFRRGGELADRFRLDLGMQWRDFVDHMPSDACFAHALVLNDLMRLRAAVPGFFESVELDRRQYYLGCLNDYRKAARQGARRDRDLAALLTALDHEPPDVQASVKETKLYAMAVKAGRADKRVSTKLAALKPDLHPKFQTVFDAMAWDAAHPREPISVGLWDRMPALDDMKGVRRGGSDEAPRTTSDRIEGREQTPEFVLRAHRLRARLIERRAARRATR